jgi:hypothetical protein
MLRVSLKLNKNDKKWNIWTSHPNLSWYTNISPVTLRRSAQRSKPGSAFAEVGPDGNIGKDSAIAHVISHLPLNM